MAIARFEVDTKILPQTNINALGLGYREQYILDTDADAASLPQCAPGSQALSPTGTIFIVNASGQWVEFGTGNPVTTNG